MKLADRPITTYYWRWIPAVEQLPPEGWVLICIQPRIGPRHVNIGNWDAYRKQWRSRLGWKVEGQVTHWMPLPEPPTP